MQRPTTRQWALLGTVTLVLSTLGFSTYGLLSDDAAPGASRAGAADDRAGGVAGIGPIGLSLAAAPDIRHTSPFPLESGERPTKSDALDFTSRYSRFIAKGTEGLDRLAREGHLKGSGTQADPYILERFYVDGDLTIESTARGIVLRNGYVNGQLTLNYVGEQVYVHHVYAKDLRINENIERSGHNTGGLFHDNHFGFVGQIRHFVGAFRDNQVGPAPEGIVRTYLSDTGDAELPAGVVFNLDGFHGAHIHDNVFDGQVDIKLHGHNHGDCLTCPIHDHADPDQLAFDEAIAEEDDHDHDDDHDDGDDHSHAMTLQDALGFRTRHSIRYHSLLFESNTIKVPSGTDFALRYNDLAHAGDDRTANSEPSRFLEDPHVHYQDITIRDNVLGGAPLRVQVFNAADVNHPTQNLGVLRLTGNTVDIPYQRTTTRPEAPLIGFDLREADGIQLDVRGNTVRFTEQKDTLPMPALRGIITYAPELIGFRLDGFTTGNVSIIDNAVDRGTLGLYAHLLAPDLYWTLAHNDFRTEQDWRGDQVARAPEGGDGA